MYVLLSSFDGSFVMDLVAAINDVDIRNFVMTLSPLYKNVIISQLMVVYFKITLEVLVWFVRSRTFGSHTTMMQGYSKQCMYLMLSSSIIVFWPLFDTTDWSYRLNIIVPLAMLVRLVYKVSMFLGSRSNIIV
jgi:hypothetical protein